MRSRRSSFIPGAVFAACALSVLGCQSATRPTSTDAFGGTDESGIDATEGADPGIDAALAAATVNHALNFSTSYVNVPDNDLLDLTSTWTLEAWVKPVD